MYKQIKVTAIFVSFLMLASLSTAIAQRPTPTPRPRNLYAGAVYVMTNQVNNAVAVFLRTARGALTSAGEFSTGGAGNPVPQGMDPATDPLASQGALILGHGNQFLSSVTRYNVSVTTITASKSYDAGGIVGISFGGGEIPEHEGVVLLRSARQLTQPLGELCELSRC